MMRMTFVFDKNKLRQIGKSADEIIAPMRDHARKWDIKEVAPYQFEKDGEDAMCDLFMFMSDILDKDRSYYTYFSSWYVEEDGHFKEDCIAGAKDVLEVKELNRAG